jgi:hypothetical protein
MTRETYLRELGGCLSVLDADERREIVAEVRAHFAERMAQGRADPVAGFDPPEVYAASFVEISALSKAVARGGSVALGRALLSGVRTSVETLFLVVPLLALQTIAFVSLVLGVLKPFFFAQIGIYVGDGPFWMGFFKDTSGRTDLLGWWTVPVFIIPSAFVLWGCNRAMRALARARLERARRAKSVG